MKLNKLIASLLIVSQSAFASGEAHFPKGIITEGSASVGQSAPAAASAVLDISSTTKGMLPPRMTQTQRDAIASPANGLEVFNTTTNKLNIYNGSVWGAVGSGSGGGSGVNYLSNAGFEDNTTHSSWTVATAAAANETTTVYEGLNSTKLTYAATTGGISQDVTPTQNTASVNMEASCKVLTSLTTIQVCGRSGGADLTNCTAVPSTGTWQYVVYNFVGPSNGTSVGVDVKTSASTTGSFYVDDCYVGPARNLSQVSQAQYLGGLTMTGTDNTVAATGTSDFAAMTSPTYSNATGIASNPTGNAIAVTYPNVPPGSVRVDFTSFLRTNGNASCGWIISDGTTDYTATWDVTVITGQYGHGNVSATFTYTQAASRTFKLRVNQSVANGCYVATATQPARFEAYYFPSQQQIAVSSSMGPSVTDWASVSPTVSNIPGAVSNAYGRRVGDTFEMTMDFTASGNATGSILVNLPSGYVMDTTKRSGQLLGFANANLSSGNYSGTAYVNNTASFFLVGPSNNFWSSGIPNTWSNGFGFTVHVSIPIVGWTSPTMMAPQLVGSLTTGGAGANRFVSLAVDSACTADPCTITSQSETWAVVNRVGTGTYDINITSGIFSARPRCTFAIGNVGNMFGLRLLSAPTATKVQIATATISGGVTATADGAFEIQCDGPR